MKYLLSFLPYTMTDLSPYPLSDKQRRQAHGSVEFIVEDEREMLRYFAMLARHAERVTVYRENPAYSFGRELLCAHDNHDELNLRLRRAAGEKFEDDEGGDE